MILFGLVTQVWSILLRGPAHQFSYWYTGMMVVLFLSNVTGFGLHLRDRTRTGVLLSAWIGLFCVFAMVCLDTIVDTQDGFPWVILTLHLAAYAVGEVVGGNAAIVYAMCCGLALLITGIIQDKIDDALPALLVLLLVFIWSRRSFYVGRELDDLRRYVDIEIDGAKTKLKQRGSTRLGEKA